MFKKRYPVSVTFISTYRCNFECSYCDVYRKKNYEMTTQEIKDMIDQLYELGLLRLGFNGGEPLLRDDLGELINYSRSKGIITTVFTNGWLIEEKIDILKNLSTLIISLDGPAEIHDKQRKKGSYERVIAGIKSARKNGIPVWTNTVVTKNNINSLGFILEKARQYDFRTIYQPVLSYSHSSQKSSIDQFAPSLEENRKAFNYLIQQKRANAPIVHSTTVLEHMSVPDWSVNKRKCWAGKLYFAVTPDGCIAPCYPIFNSDKWPDGRAIGYKKAIESIQNFTCTGCYCILAEADYVYSFSPEVLINTLKLNVKI